MSDIYDLVIYARGLQASLLVAEAVDSGLRVALVQEGDCNNERCIEPIVINYDKKDAFGLYKTLKSENFFKKAAAHLLIHSNLRHYRHISFFSKLLINFSSIWKYSKIRFIKENKNPGLEYSVFKYSSNRMTISLLKYAKENGAHIYMFSSLISTQYEEKDKYKINFYNKYDKQDFSLNAKSILINPVIDNAKALTDKKIKTGNEDFFFTYPSEKLELRDNIIYEIKNLRIKIISWFNVVYFTISGDESVTLDQAIQLINKHLPQLIIEIENVLTYGLSKQIDKVVLEKGCRFIFHHQEKQILFPYQPIDKWFVYSNMIINKIIKQLKIGIQSKPVIQRVVLQGSDFGFDYHPLRIMEYADERFDEAKHIMKSQLEFKKLFYRYGTEIELITNKAYEYWNQTKNPETSWLRAEIWYSINFEICKTAESFINTRTDLWMLNGNVDIKIINQIFNELNE